MNWIPCTERLPADRQRVLCWLPSNTVHLSGLSETESRNVVVLRFAKDWFIKNPSKTRRNVHRHFWLGEGSSNCFFEQVSHWMEMPAGPAHV